MSIHHFTIRGEQTLLDDQPILLKGLRLSNALLDDRATEAVIGQLDVYRTFGINSFSVYVMGNRFGDVKGYREDATIDLAHAERLQRLLRAADEKAMVVLVGCLYWGHSRAKWDTWRQEEADHAVASTARWLLEHDFRHVMLDPDNEGMAYREAGFDNHQLVVAAQQAAPGLPVAINSRHQDSPAADLTIHHSAKVAGRPYVETEGSPPMEGGYWGQWSNPFADEWYQYDHIGEYTEAMRQAQLEATFAHLDRGDGYFFASTWLQAAPPLGPNFAPGGMGVKNDPGMKWWLEAVRERFGPYEQR